MHFSVCWLIISSLQQTVELHFQRACCYLTAVRKKNKFCQILHQTSAIWAHIKTPILTPGNMWLSPWCLNMSLGFAVFHWKEQDRNMDLESSILCRDIGISIEYKWYISGALVVLSAVCSPWGLNTFFKERLYEEIFPNFHLTLQETNAGAIWFFFLLLQCHYLDCKCTVEHIMTSWNALWMEPCTHLWSVYRSRADGLCTMQNRSKIEEGDYFNCALHQSERCSPCKENNVSIKTGQ